MANMLIAKVIGTVVCTVKAPDMEGIKFLVVNQIDDDLNPVGKPFVAVDALRTTGEGEFVEIVTKKEACFAFDNHMIPVDATVIAHIDYYHVNKDLC